MIQVRKLVIVLSKNRLYNVIQAVILPPIKRYRVIIKNQTSTTNTVSTEIATLDVARAYRTILSAYKSGDTLDFYYLSHLPSRDAVSGEIIPAYTAQKIALTFTVSDTADFLSLVGSNGGINGICEKAKSYAVKAGFNSQKLRDHGIDQDNFYACFSWVKKDQPAQVITGFMLREQVSAIETLIKVGFKPVSLAMLDKSPETAKPENFSNRFVPVTD